MMSADEVRASENSCMEVRRGQLSHLEPMIGSFIEDPRGPLSIFRRERSPKVEVSQLLAVSEALEARGRYRESVRPLETLVGRKEISPDLRDIALARAGQIGVLHGLPMDLGPIVSELGLSRKDLGSAIQSFRRKRDRREPLRDMERHLLQALLLDEGAEHVESRSLGADHVKGALDGFQLALSLAAEVEGEVGEFHRTRCMYHLGSFMLKRGDLVRGPEVIDVALRKAEEGEFMNLMASIRKVKGFYEDDLDEAVKLLGEAEEASNELGNILEAAEIVFIRGNRSASESSDADVVKEGIELMLSSANKVEELGYDEMGASYRSEAALWNARTGNPGDGVKQARTAFRYFKGSDDREAMIRAGCILFFCYIRADERRRAKKLLLDLITNHPVKQFPASFGILREAVTGVQWLREDRDTKELFEDEVVYTIERVAVDEIITRAKEAYPNEFGAMLRGIPDITHIEPVMEGASNRSSFLFSLYSRFSQRNVEGEGVVHSHPSGSARPSRADLSMFGRFPGINIIIGYPFRDDSMAAYDRLGNRVRLEIVDNRRGRAREKGL
ncbi:MAG: Mov34/MPN/PAD-1 family protein [Thermoplasmatota archaeon]